MPWGSVPKDFARIRSKANAVPNPNPESEIGASPGVIAVVTTAGHAVNIPADDDEGANFPGRAAEGGQHDSHHRKTCISSARVRT